MSSPKENKAKTQSTHSSMVFTAPIYASNTLFIGTPPAGTASLILSDGIPQISKIHFPYLITDLRAMRTE
ncbi:uncharacterized protein EAE97_007718 [Botrytis byssoidea]|uniref:Uncharacterized protein n=1 Tax=Botrytis byssoidea TaxID=139641 RepID=A0A9P5LW66_9HELO|nr:uncharacterized protein EAE97_007718 [Botrytis byssoidea]KAF7937922.1 hypothetical protein EAE97_007718 [Botrytis byssoidea]